MTAVPKGGHGLDHWELDGVNVGPANPYTATVDADRMLKAFLKEL